MKSWIYVLTDEVYAHFNLFSSLTKGLIGCLLPPAWLALEIQALRGLAGSMQQHCVWMHVSVEPGYTEKMIGYPDEWRTHARQQLWKSTHTLDAHHGSQALEKRPKFSYLRCQARALGLHAASQAADPNQASNQGTLAPHGPGQGSIRATNQAHNDSGGEAGDPARDGRGKKILFPYVFIRCPIATTALL